MAKVVALHQGSIGTADGIGMDLVKGKIYDTNSPEYKAAKSLFGPVEEDAGTEMAALKARIAELELANTKAQLAALQAQETPPAADATPEPAPEPAPAPTAASTRGTRKPSAND